MRRRPVSIGVLLAETWAQYRVRALPILAVMLLGLAVTLLVVLSEFTLFTGVLLLIRGDFTPQMTATTPLLEDPVFLGHLLFVLLLLALFLLWVQSATIAITMERECGILEALVLGGRRMWSLGWILLLTFGIVTTGALLLLLPGLVFFVWFLFAVFILYEEDCHGLEALLASRAYVRGHWWSTLFKFAVVFLISMLLGLVPVAGPVLAFLFKPFLLLFLVLLYRDLKEVHGGRAAAEGNYFLWGGLAFCGLLLLLLGSIGAVVTLGPQLPRYMEQMFQRGFCPVERQTGLHDPVPQSGEVPPAVTVHRYRQPPAISST